MLLVGFESASLVRGGAGGALDGAGISKELLDWESLLVVPSLFLGASCSLKSSLGCGFVAGGFVSSVGLGEALGFPFLFESFRTGRSW